MIYSLLHRIGVLCLPGYAIATELITTENSVPQTYIVTVAEGLLKSDDDEIGASQTTEDKIAKIIQGNATGFGIQSHFEVKHLYTSAMQGFTATLDDIGLKNVLSSPDVLSVEEDGVIELDHVGSWGLDRIDDKDLPLDGSYNPAFGNGGAGVTAYVIDTGILTSHLEFEGRATQEFNSIVGDPNSDCHGHGTHVAGTIGAKNYGVANKVKLVGVKVLSCRGSGTWSGVIAGVDWVKRNAKKPATVNLSLGGGRSTAVNSAIKALVNSGVSTVVAAGNNNGNACYISPASEPTAITVAATANNDARAWFSNWGACVDIFAPGVSIKAPWIGFNTATRTISGTSMASPHVCGAVALYLGQDKTLSVSAVTSKILGDSIKNTISNPGSQTPNRMLYTGTTVSKGVKGRCGPLFGGRSCDCTTYERYCNTANGWCGVTSAHKNAQAGTEYDCKGRCGPLFGGRSCDCSGYEMYCNTANGWCGTTDAHKNAQAGSEYDCRPGSQGRCGPLFGGRRCDCTTYEKYCNTYNGWCGVTSAHKNAQPGNEYDCIYN